MIDEQDVIVVGHTRYKAAMKLGLATVPAHVARGLTPEQARAYRIADNRTAALSHCPARSRTKRGSTSHVGRRRVRVCPPRHAGADRVAFSGYPVTDWPRGLSSTFAPMAAAHTHAAEPRGATEGQGAPTRPDRQARSGGG